MENVVNISLLFEQRSSFATVKVFIHALMSSKQQPGKFFFFYEFYELASQSTFKEVSLVFDVKEE